MQKKKKKQAETNFQFHEDDRLKFQYYDKGKFQNPSKSRTLWTAFDLRKPANANCTSKQNDTK